MPLTKPLNVAPAYQGAPQLEERLLVDIGPPLVAYLRPPVAVQPRQRPLHHPPVPAQPFAGLDAAPGDARGYAPLSESLSAPGKVVALIRVQLLRALARAAKGLADRRDGVHGLLQCLGVVDVWRCESPPAGCLLGRPQHGASSLTCLCPSGSGRSFGPPGAGTLAESKDARSQSISSALPRRSRSVFRSRSHTPRPHATP